MPITPNYQRVYDAIVQLIESGKLKPGDELPSTSKLMAQYNVGNNAVQRAMWQLEERGYITTHPGKARYVREREK